MTSPHAAHDSNQPGHDAVPRSADLDPITQKSTTHFKGYGPQETPGKCAGTPSGRHTAANPGTGGYLGFRTVEIPWQREAASGDVEVKVLRESAQGDAVRLWRLAPGSSLPITHFPAGADVLVLEGYIEVEGEFYPAGAFLWLPPGRSVTVSSPLGCDGATLFTTLPACPDHDATPRRPDLGDDF